MPIGGAAAHRPLVADGRPAARRPVPQGHQVVGSGVDELDGVRPWPATSTCSVARCDRRWNGEEASRVLWTLATGTRAVSRTRPPRRATTWSSTVAQPEAPVGQLPRRRRQRHQDQGQQPRGGSHSGHRAAASASRGTTRRTQARRRAAPGAGVGAAGGGGPGQHLGEQPIEVGHGHDRHGDPASCCST